MKALLYDPHATQGLRLGQVADPVPRPSRRSSACRLSRSTSASSRTGPAMPSPARFKAVLDLALAPASNLVAEAP
jgi:hypothetical protein